MSEDIQKLLRERDAVPIWPVAGKALGLGRSATYAAFHAGEIPGAFKILSKPMAATAPLRRFLGIETK